MFEMRVRLGPPNIVQTARSLAETMTIAVAPGFRRFRVFNGPDQAEHSMLSLKTTTPRIEFVAGFHEHDLIDHIMAGDIIYDGRNFIALYISDDEALEMQNWVVRNPTENLFRIIENAARCW